MIRKWLTAAAVPVALALSVATPSAAQAAGDAEIAAYWAPVHYQDTNDWDYDADYLTKVDFDGDWFADNNWDNQDDDPSRLTGAVYYSVVATTTHWYVLYGFFHPRDWSNFPDPVNQLEHENDMEGALLVVRKDDVVPFGVLEAMVTVSHDDFYSFTPPGSPFVDGQEDIDGAVVLESFDGHGRPTTYQQDKGHGCLAWDGKDFPGGDGVVYYPAAMGQVPTGGNDRKVQYELIDIFGDGGLWARRNSPATFASFGVFKGDDGADDAAKAPWGWDDHDDGDALQKGLLATDPAKLVDRYFAATGNFSLTYVSNGYF